MKKNKIKFVTRFNVPETNSSGSHSLVLNLGDKSNLIDPRTIDGINIKDDVLYLEKEFNFGWGDFVINTAPEKLQYLLALFCSSVRYETRYIQLSIYDQKKIFKLKQLLKKIFKVKDVVLDFVDEYFKSPKREREFDPPRIFCSGDDDLIYEITESEETLNNYLFNPNCFLLGNKGEYDEVMIDNLGFEYDEVNAIATIDFGGDFGVVDFEITDIAFSGLRSLSKSVNSLILDYICYDEETGSIRLLDYYNIKIDSYTTNLFFPVHNIIAMINNDYYIVFCRVGIDFWELVKKYDNNCPGNFIRLTEKDLELEKQNLKLYEIDIEYVSL